MFYVHILTLAEKGATMFWWHAGSSLRGQPRRRIVKHSRSANASFRPKQAPARAFNSAFGEPQVRSMHHAEGNAVKHSRV